VNPVALLARHCDPSSRAFEILVTHSVLVTAKARAIAASYLERVPDAAVDLDFLTEAAMLHDVGIVRCDAPVIGCEGDEDYLRHGVLGREILDREGLPRHALVCERHTGAGIASEDVRRRALPLPERDYLPISLEERIICVADKFFSKTPSKLWREKPLDEIGRRLAKHGPQVAERWDALRRDILGD